ncbi:MAG: M24 family metallopeptidase, partial [Planctomycetota bacterium]
MIQRHANAVDFDAARAAAQRVVTIHRRLVEFLRAGLTLAQIDTFVAEQLADLRCRSCFLRYRVPRLPPFPSFACLSPNDCIVHGTAG